MIINIRVFDLMQVKVEGWWYNAFYIMIMLATAMIWNLPKMILLVKNYATKQ